MPKRQTRRAKRSNRTRKARSNLNRQNGTRRLLPKLDNGSEIVRNWMSYGKTNQNIRRAYLINPSIPGHVKNQIMAALNRVQKTGSVYA
jgi:hypothetical protein